MIGKVLSFKEELQKSASKRKIEPMKVFFVIIGIVITFL